MTYDEFKKIQNSIITRAPITFVCKDCGITETMTKDRLMLRDDLVCTQCARDRNIVKKYGSKDNFLKIRNQHQMQNMERKYGEGVTNPS